MNPLDVTNDANPEFITEFYTNLRILNQDLYKRLSLAGGGGTATADLSGSLRPTSLPLSDRPSPSVQDRGLPPSGLQPVDAEKHETDDQFNTPKKLRHNAHSRSQTELALLNSLEKAREHIHNDRTLRGATGAGEQGYFTNQALQERIKAYTKRGSSQAVPADFFNRYMNEGESNAATMASPDGAFPIGLQRYDSGTKAKEDIAKRGGGRRRHSLGAGSFDKDALQALASGGASDKSPDKAEGAAIAELTPSKTEIARADSFRHRK